MKHLIYRLLYRKRIASLQAERRRLIVELARRKKGHRRRKDLSWELNAVTRELMRMGA